MTEPPTVLVSSWSDGLSILQGGAARREFAGSMVSGMESDGVGGAYLIVDSKDVWARAPDGSLRLLASSDRPLRCCLKVGGRLLVATDDARVLELSAAGWSQLEGFDAASDRDRWYAGAALIDGKMIGPPLGVRSMCATCDGRVLLVNVHVGGIPRSVDGGASWRPTIDIDVDVHQVSAHPSRPEIVAAAAGAGLCISRDGGASWSLTTAGLHASYGSAVAMTEDAIYLAASADHFADEGAIYRRRIDADGPLERVGGGLPLWLDGIADTYCIAARDDVLAVVDRGGHLYGSDDGGRSWSSWTDGLPIPSGVLLC